jgi:hypothetical protein
MLSKRQRGKEEVISYRNIPANLKGLERESFKMKHDGYIHQLKIFNVKKGKLEREHELWCTAFDLDHMLMNKDTVRILRYEDSNVKVDANGNISLFSIQRYGYGLGASEDGKLLISGGNATGAILNAEDKYIKKFIPHVSDKLPGWPEFFNRFVVGSDGWIYGVSSASRLWKIAGDGTIDAISPVY